MTEVDGNTDVAEVDKGEVALKILYNFNSMLVEMAAYAEAQATNPYLTALQRHYWEAPYTCYSGLSAALRESIDVACDGDVAQSPVAVFPMPNSTN